MLGLKREIIKERDAVGDVGQGGTQKKQETSYKAFKLRAKLKLHITVKGLQLQGFLSSL